MDDIDLNPFRRCLLKHGTQADARVLDVTVSAMQQPDAFLTRKYTVEVQPADEAPFQTHIKEAFTLFWAPKRGDLLKVRYNPRTHKAAFDLKGDPRYDADMQKPAGQWTEGEAPPPSIYGTRATRMATPTDMAALLSSLTASASASATPATVADRLAQVDAMRAAGTITAAEHAEQRARILQSL